MVLELGQVINFCDTKASPRSGGVDEGCFQGNLTTGASQNKRLNRPNTVSAPRGNVHRNPLLYIKQGLKVARKALSQWEQEYHPLGSCVWVRRSPAQTARLSLQMDPRGQYCRGFAISLGQHKLLTVRPPLFGQFET